MGARPCARGALRGHGVAAVRAGPARVRVAGRDRHGAGGPRRRLPQGAWSPLCRGGAPRARLPRARPLRKCCRRPARARGSDPVLRGRRDTRRARARRRGDPPAASRRRRAGPDRRRRPLARAVARAARDRVLNARDPVRDRRPGAPAPDAVRPGAAVAAPVRLVGSRPAGAVPLPPVALLGPAPRERRLRGGAPPRAGDRGGRAGRGGAGGPARGQAACARRRALRPVSGRGRAGARGLDDPQRLRRGAAARR